MENTGMWVNYIATELQKLVTATKQRGNKMQKLIILSLSDLEEQRAALKAFIDNSKFNNDRAGLAEQLSKIHPFENWNARKLDNWLNGAKGIPSHQLIQLLNYIEPDEPADYSFTTLQEGLERCRVLINEFENEMIAARLTENKIDEKEFDLLKSRAALIIRGMEKLVCNVQRVAGHTLA